MGEVTAFAGISTNYVGDRKGIFIDSQHGDAATPRQDFPAYTKTDLSVGAKYEGWTFTLYGNNIMDRRGLLSGGAGQVTPRNFTLIQPRTIGLSVMKAL